jgi:hypothetical protein
MNRLKDVQTLGEKMAWAENTCTALDLTTQLDKLKFKGNISIEKLEDLVTQLKHYSTDSYYAFVFTTIA